METFNFYQISKITSTSPLECLKEYQNLCLHWVVLMDASLTPVSMNSVLDKNEAEILIHSITGKSCIELLLEK